MSIFLQNRKFQILTAFILSIHCIFAGQTDSQENPYARITELGKNETTQNLWNDYCREQNVHSAEEWSQKYPHVKFEKYPHINFLSLQDYTDKYSQFLETFPNLEELVFPNIDSDLDIHHFAKNLPHLPHLKTLILRAEASSILLDSIPHFQNLESLRINWAIDDPIDLTPLEKLKNLTKLELLGDDSTPIMNANKIPASVKSLELEDVQIDVSDLSHLKLKHLDLTLIPFLPPKTALSELESLIIYGCPIKDLKPLENNQSIKEFSFSNFLEDGNYVELSPISTFKNLEALSLRDPFLTNKNFSVIANGLLHLKELSISGPWLDMTNSSFWNNLPLGLKKLELPWNCCDMTYISKFPLTYLDIAYATIQNAHELVHLAPSLEHLEIPGEVLSSFLKKHGEGIFKDFSKLRVLNIEDLDPYFKSLDFLKYFPSLEDITIDISDIRQTLAPEVFDVFIEMKNLKRIDIRGTTFEQWKRLQELAELGVSID